VAKRTVEVCVVKAGVERMSGMRTDGKRRERLSRLLRKGDVVGMEAWAYAFVPARYLKREVGCTVYILNPGKLGMIWQSTKKTDKEDALKLANFIQRYQEEKLPLVSLPAEREVNTVILVHRKQLMGQCP
jgi:transposase